jgi:hypothetical protein
MEVEAAELHPHGCPDQVEDPLIGGRLACPDVVARSRRGLLHGQEVRPDHVLHEHVVPLVLEPSLKIVGRSRRRSCVAKMAITPASAFGFWRGPYTLP